MWYHMIICVIMWYKFLNRYTNAQVYPDMYLFIFDKMQFNYGIVDKKRTTWVFNDAYELDFQLLVNKYETIENPCFNLMKILDFFENLLPLIYLN